MNDAVLDMLQFSRNEKALDFENAFKDIMNDRITDAINNKKQKTCDIIVTGFFIRILHFAPSSKE
jgi:hypothetical protein